MGWSIIENGHVAGTTNTGGAIAAINSSPEIRYCTLRHNLSNNPGAAVYLESSGAIIEGCMIEDNLIAYPAGGAGGGIYATDPSSQIPDNLIRNNVVQVNYTSGPASGAGDGICLVDCSATVKRNRILDHLVHATGNVGTSARGGGVYCRSGASTSAIATSTETIPTSSDRRFPRDWGQSS